MTQLLDVPAPPEVRAAAFTVLAEIPGVRSMGKVKDADGRLGLRIELTHTSGDVVEHHQLILDSASHQILSSRYSATVIGQQGTRPIKEQKTVSVQAAWTDQKP